MKKLLTGVLLVALLMSMLPKVTRAESLATTGDANVKTEIIDGKIVLTLSAGGDLSAFEYGIVYDDSDLTVEKVEWDEFFYLNYYKDNGILTYKSVAKERYVALAGVSVSDFNYGNSVIAKITFVPKENVEDTQMGIVVDPSQIIRNSGVLFLEEGFQNTGEHEETLLGDVDGNGILNITDAKMALKMSVLAGEFSPEQKQAADVDKDGIVTKGDARRILKEAYIMGYQSSDIVFKTRKFDGKIEVVDAENILEAVTALYDLSESESKMADMTEDGQITVLDAQNMLKYTLGVQREFDKTTESDKIVGISTGTPEMSVRVLKDKVIVTIGAKGNLERFDFGLTYDSQQLTVENIKWARDFEFDYVGGGEGLCLKKDNTTEEYIALTGIAKEVFFWDGAVATIEFLIKEGTEKINSQKLYKDAAAVMDKATVRTLEESEALAVTESAVIDFGKKLGDVNENGVVEIEDAQNALQIALLLKETYSTEEYRLADMNENGVVELSDAQKILRQALLL